MPARTSSRAPSWRAAFLAGAFLAGAFLAGAFLAGAFLAGAFLTAAFLAGAAFFALAFFAGAAFFVVVFFADRDTARRAAVAAFPAKDLRVLRAMCSRPSCGRGRNWDHGLPGRVVAAGGSLKQARPGDA